MTLYALHIKCLKTGAILYMSPPFDESDLSDEISELVLKPDTEYKVIDITTGNYIDQKE